jgi:hypothetical protein
MEDPARKQIDAQPRPLTIGSDNAEAMTGRPMRWWQTHAAELGIEPIRIGGRVLFVADDLLGALARLRVSTPARPIAAEPGTTDELETMREQLAARLRTAGGGR